MSERKTRLVDCNPRWVGGRYAGRKEGAASCGVHFDCPEGHEGCSHAVPFTPDLDGTEVESWYESKAQWRRTGATFETLTLTPSIAPGPSSTCRFHGFVTAGAITFCGDSR